MNYRLYKDGKARIEVAGTDLPDNPGAIEWAKGWLEKHADHDLYAVERADGGFAVRLIRSAGGEWYAMLEKGFVIAE